MGAMGLQMSKTFYGAGGGSGALGVGGVSDNGIKCYHQNKDMKWARSKLQKTLNGNSGSKLAIPGDFILEEAMQVDPSKTVSHDAIFKKRQTSSKLATSMIV